MQKGQPLAWEALLPPGMGADDVLIALAALGVFLVVWSLGSLFTQRDHFGPRLKAIAERRAELKGELTAARRRRKPAGDKMSLVRQIVAQLKLLQQHQVEELQKKLVRAGFRHKDAVVLFAFAKLVMPFVGLAAGALVSGLNWADPFRADQTTEWLMFIGLGYLGARLPEIIVANAKERRTQALRKGLPDALDLMMICAEAGLSLAAALDRVAREMGRVSPELAEEFSLASVELGFLPDRTQALKNLADRCDLKELRGFTNVILQTEKYGTPIAQALRVLSKEFRTERMLRAEQKAARLPALMTVPMIVFILPTLFIIIMTPAVLRMMDNF